MSTNGVLDTNDAASESGAGPSEKGAGPSEGGVVQPDSKCNEEEEELLSKLLQQNKLLEEDVRFTTRIAATTTSSTPSLPKTHISTSDPTLRSHDQAGWKSKLKKLSPKTVSTSSLRSSSSEVAENSSSTKSSPTRNRMTPESSKDPPTVNLPNGSPEQGRGVESETPVPCPLTPSSASSSLPAGRAESPVKASTSAAAAVCVPEANGEEEEEEEEKAGLPVAGGGSDTIRSYHLVLQEGEEEANARNHEGEQVVSKAEEEGHSSPAGSASSSVPQVGGAVNGEEGDVLSELPSSAAVKLRRPRSETESRGPRVSLIPFKSRKRSQTLHEVEGQQNKDDPEEKPVSVEETQWQQWSELLKNWEESGAKNSKLVRHLTRQGVPEHLRGMAWQLLSNSINSELKDKYPALITESSPHERAIKRDLNRTFPEHAFFMERDGLGQESLLNVLKAYSVYDKEVGYCQGSPFIVGLLLMQMPEEEAFCVLVNLMTTYQLRDFYKPSMTDLSLCFYQLEKLIEETYPLLSKHFKAVGFQTSIYASPWFLTMFASVLSLNVAFRVMDLVMVEGKEFMFRVGLALLETSREDLVKMDMEEMMKYFQKGMKSLHESEPEQLIQRALKIKLHSKRMKKFAKEYLDKKARKALEITEMTRLQNENMEVSMRLSQMQHECESLAQQLISGRIERAQEAEEMLQLRRDLALARKKLEEIGRQGSATQLEKEEEVGVVSPDRSETGTAEHGDESDEERKSGSVLADQSPSSPPVHTEVGVADQGGGDNIGYWTQSSHSTLYKEGSSSPQNSPFIHRGHSTDSKQNLFQEGDTSEASPAPAAHHTPAMEEESEELQEKKKKKKRLLGRSKSGRKLQKVDSQGVADSPIAYMEDKERKKKKKKKDKKKEKESVGPVDEEDLERELVLAKTQLAEYASQLEEKTWQWKQAQQREKALNDEVEELTGHLTILQAKLSKVNSSDLCSQCWSKVALGGESSSLPNSTSEDAGPLSSQALLTNLRAIWKSSPQPTHKDIT